MMYCSYYGVNSGKRGYLKVTGTGTVTAVPDTAIANLGIVTENPVLETARNENAVRTASVVNMLAKMGVEKKHIHTGNFSIDPLYDYVDGKQTFRGYRVTNLLTVTIKDIARAGEIIDRATHAGVNRVDSISFTLSDESHYYDNALRLAIENALHKASEIGSAINVEIDDIPFKIIEKSIEATRYTGISAKLAASSTPLLPGQIEITSIISALIGYRG